jgi:hypothetical protein
MTVSFPASLAGSTTAFPEDRFVVIDNPCPGTIIELAPGSQLGVRFRPGLGPSRWHAVGVPGHLLVLAERGHEFQFLVFGTQEGPVPLRFERRHPEREIASDVRELLVVPVLDAPVTGRHGVGGRTSRSA